MTFKKTFALLALMTAATMSYGQAVSTNGGSIQGTIADPSGAAIPGATVVIADPATGYTHTLTTDNAGFYSLGPLLPGSYTITVSATNFEGLKVTTVVRTGTATSGSEKLTIGKSSETIQVDAGALQINTDQIGLSGVVTREQIDSLPINGRNILDIAQIQPGVILQSGESFDPTKAGYSAISVGGVSGRTTRIILDGQDITDETVGTTIFNVPSGAIQEFQLNQSTQDVSGEVTSTGQVLVSTQSGTNKIHANGFYNFQDARALDAQVDGVPKMDSSGNVTGYGQAPFQRNQFGGYFGGPIIKDKLFIFGGIERIKQSQGISAGTNSLFESILQQYPLIPAPFTDTYSTARLDYSGPKGIHFFARATYSVNSDSSTFGYGPYAIYQNRDNVPALIGGADFTTGKFTHSFRGGYEKFHNLLGDGTAALAGSIYNPSTGPTNQISLVGSLNAGPNFLAPQQTYQSDKQFRYDGSWTRGAHTIKFGGSMNRILNGGFADFYGPSLYTDLAAIPELETLCAVPTSSEDGTCANDPVNGYAAAVYVLGNGNGLFSERPGFGLTGGGDPSWRFGAYGADTWKVSSVLTLTAGLRWSVDTDRANQDQATPLCSSVDPGLQFAGCTGDTPLYDQYQQGLGKKTHQPYADFGPQLGMVYSPGDHKMSIRLGAGIYYESNIFNNTGNARSEAITAPGAYFNYGAIGPGQSSIFLPGYVSPISGTGSVSSIDSVSGQPCGNAGVGTCTALSTILSEPISIAAPQINALKAVYQTSQKGVAAANPSYIGTGDALNANNLYAGPYKTPYSIQLNGGIQREILKGLIVSADYVHNATLKIPLSQDVNHIGAASTYDSAAAANAVANLEGECGVTTVAGAVASCPGLYGAGGGGIQLGDLSGAGFDSSAVLFGGAYPYSAVGAPAHYAVFAGNNQNVGQGLFILPIGRSGYDAGEFVVKQQKAHPLPGIVSSNIQISYTLSRIVSSSGGGQDQFFGGAKSYNNNNPNSVIGRNNIDHSNELSFGGSFLLKYGPEVGFIGHFYSAPPTNLTLDTGGSSAGQIFQTDVNGDGATGDLVPGTNPGAYMHAIKGKGLNKLIATYNSQDAGQPTPAGQALINSGLFTLGQLQSIGAVQQPISFGPDNPLNTPPFREFDMNASYPVKLSHVHEGLTITPGIAFYNVFNMANFGGFSGVLLNQPDAGQFGYLNGDNAPGPGGSVLNNNRVQRGSGTFDQGGPRTTEFQLKVSF